MSEQTTEVTTAEHGAPVERGQVWEGMKRPVIGRRIRVEHLQPLWDDVSYVVLHKDGSPTSRRGEIFASNLQARYRLVKESD